jgi:hypothetical protein
MRPRWYMAIVVCFSAVTGAFAEQQDFVSPTYSRAVSKTTSYFDSWSPSAAKRQISIDRNPTRVWEALQYVTYRTAQSLQGLGLFAAPSMTEAPMLAPSPTFAWKAFSMENMYQVWDAEDFPIAVALSIQPRTSDQAVNIAETFVIGRSYDFWKWALNFSQGTEWSNRIKERDGAMELAWELGRSIGKYWSVGLEFRDHSDLPEYRRIASSRVFVGPTVRCNHDNWWMALSVMPKMLSFDFVANSDSQSDQEFEGNQKLTTRVMFGMAF